LRGNFKTGKINRRRGKTDMGRERKAERCRRLFKKKIYIRCMRVKNSLIDDYMKLTGDREKMERLGIHIKYICNAIKVKEHLFSLIMNFMVNAG
jgi:hypothetical protein